MKGNKGKVLALGVIVMFCAVAIIGAGYAAFAGTAKTYNENNSVIAGNIVIANGTYTPMVSNANEVFSTYTYNDTTEKVAYYFETPTDIHDLKAVSLGTAKTMGVTNNTGAAIAKLNIGAKASTAISTGDYKYFFKVTTSGTSTNEYFIDLPVSGTGYAYTGEITLDMGSGAKLADGGSVNVTIQLYVGYVANVYVPDDYIGAASTTKGGTCTIDARNGTAPADIADVDFGFVVLTPDS